MGDASNDDGSWNGENREKWLEEDREEWTAYSRWGNIEKTKEKRGEALEEWHLKKEKERNVQNDEKKKKIDRKGKIWKKKGKRWKKI